MLHLPKQTALIILTLLSSYCSGTSRAPQINPKAEWTILIYMNGDNSLEKDALNNFRELARVGSTNDVNIIVQFDRIGKYGHTTPDWKQTLRFRITSNMEPLKANAIEDIGEKDMGKGQTLSEFVSWGTSNYPANHYMLDIWDHGQGYRFAPENSAVATTDKAFVRSSKELQNNNTLRAETQSLINRKAIVIGDPIRSSIESPHRACSLDETNSDELYNREIEDALSLLLRGNKIDLIGFDCCLMAMLETTYAMRNIAKYFVGSEDLEPGAGWRYNDWMAKLVANPKMNGEELSKILVESYKARYHGQNIDETTTMSAIDLSRMDSIIHLMTNFSNILTSKLATNLTEIKGCRQDCKHFAPDYDFYHIDFLRFAELISLRSGEGILKNSADSLIGAIKKYIVTNYAGDERGDGFGSNGLAIYFPENGHIYKSDPYAKNGYEKTNTYFPVDFVQHCSWTDFLHAYYTYER